MRKAFLLALAMVLLIAPFVTELYIRVFIVAANVAFAVWLFSKLPRRKEPEVDENQLACDLAEYFRVTNVEDGQ